MGILYSINIAYTTGIGISPPPPQATSASCNSSVISLKNQFPAFLILLQSRLMMVVIGFISLMILLKSSFLIVLQDSESNKLNIALIFLSSGLSFSSRV